MSINTLEESNTTKNKVQTKKKVKIAREEKKGPQFAEQVCETEKGEKMMRETLKMELNWVMLLMMTILMVVDMKQFKGTTSKRASSCSTKSDGMTPIGAKKMCASLFDSFVVFF